MWCLALTGLALVSVTDLWAANIGTYRANMAASQAQARGTLEANGIKYIEITPQHATSVRDRMLPEQEQLAKDMKVSAELVALQQQDVAGAA